MNQPLSLWWQPITKPRQTYTTLPSARLIAKREKRNAVIEVVSAEGGYLAIVCFGMITCLRRKKKSVPLMITFESTQIRKLPSKWLNANDPGLCGLHDTLQAAVWHTLMLWCPLLLYFLSCLRLFRECSAIIRCLRLCRSASQIPSPTLFGCCACQLCQTACVL